MFCSKKCEDEFDPTIDSPEEYDGWEDYHLSLGICVNCGESMDDATLVTAVLDAVKSQPQERVLMVAAQILSGLCAYNGVAGDLDVAHSVELARKLINHVDES